MKTLNSDFVSRLKLTGALASAYGLPLAAMRSLGKIYDAIAFSEAETKQMVIEELGNGRANYTPPQKEDWGAVEVVIEDVDAKHLLHHLETWSGYGISDRDWVNPLIEKLSAPSEPRRKETKRK